MADRPFKRANPNTIQQKFMVGYQGWFTCPGDGSRLDPNHHGWIHWLTEPLENGGRPNTDLWPDMSAYQESELYPVPGLVMKSGETARLFSSRNPDTVCRHFYWMAEHGVDGAFLQRFAGQLDLEAGNQPMRDQRDEVGRLVREAAEANGRCFSIMYDVSGVDNDRIQRIIEFDWDHLVREERILESPMYLKENGRPVVVLWGFGFSDRDVTPATVRNIFSFLRRYTPGGVYIMAGVPAHWRLSISDADSDPEWVKLWFNDVDALSPWTIGRYGDENGADNFAEEKIKSDIEEINKKNQENERSGNGKRLDYLPVIFPGGSGTNLSEGKWGFNDIKRDGGKFLWRQVYNARRMGASILYGAMWDEYDEGTAFMPVVAYKSQLPRSDKWPFLSLEEDGYDLPTDWYMRVCCLAGEVLRGERKLTEELPSKELQDYWATHPKREPEEAAASSSSSGAEGSRPWETVPDVKDEKDEPPPPPYTLEADDLKAGPAPSNAPPLIRHDARPGYVSGPASDGHPGGVYRQQSQTVQQQGHLAGGSGSGSGYQSGYQTTSFEGPSPPSGPPQANVPGGHMAGSGAKYQPVTFGDSLPSDQRSHKYDPGAPPLVHHDSRPGDVDALANDFARTSIAPPQQQYMGSQYSSYAQQPQPVGSPYLPQSPFPPQPHAAGYSTSYGSPQSAYPLGSASSHSQPQSPYPQGPQANYPYSQSPPAQGPYFPEPGRHGSYSHGPPPPAPYGMAQPSGPYGAPSPPASYGAPSPAAPYGMPSSPALYGMPPPPAPYGMNPPPVPYGSFTAGPPPPIPPRPPQSPYQPGNSFTGQNLGSSLASSGPVGGVLNVVERFTSTNTRRNLERNVDDIHRQLNRFFK